MSLIKDVGALSNVSDITSLNTVVANIWSISPERSKINHLRYNYIKDIYHVEECLFHFSRTVKFIFLFFQKKLFKRRSFGLE